MDELIYVEVLDRHGEVVSRHAARSLPVTIGRAYDNTVILGDPYVAPHHAVVERSPDGDLEISDAGSRNGLFRVGARQRIARGRIDPEAHYRVGHTEFRIRSSGDPVPPERLDKGGELRHSAMAVVALLAMAAAALLTVWAGTHERAELAKLTMWPVVLVLGVLVWAGAWSLAGRLLLGARQFIAHVTAAALAMLGIIAMQLWEYPAFALSAPALRHVAVPAIGVFLTWALWRHISLVTRNLGYRSALVAIVVAAVSVGSLKLYFRVTSTENPAEMAYLKAIKTPAVRLAQGREAVEFFRDAESLRSELEPLKTK